MNLPAIRQTPRRCPGGLYYLDTPAPCVTQECYVKLATINQPTRWPLIVAPESLASRPPEEGPGRKSRANCNLLAHSKRFQHGQNAGIQRLADVGTRDFRLFAEAY